MRCKSMHIDTHGNVPPTPYASALVRCSPE
jgi:hypothetical protein